MIYCERRSLDERHVEVLSQSIEPTRQQASHHNTSGHALASHSVCIDERTHSLTSRLLLPCSLPYITTYSWFFTYNYLSEKIPRQDTELKELGRRAVLGFCSSAISDTCSNSIRVVKVYKQSYPLQISYPQVVRNVIQESGVSGLMFRGLETKILANGLQGILFSILWKHFEEVLFAKKK
jgi:Mitochondrial carrier protein